MVTKGDVMKALEKVMDPELGRNIVDLNMVRRAEVEGDRVTVEVALTVPECPLSAQIENDTREAVRRVPGVREANIIMGAMTDEEREAAYAKVREGYQKQGKGAHPAVEVEPLKLGMSDVFAGVKILAIGSGKGGVGKSTVSANLAVALAAEGVKVGLLDADIYGFSIPRILGLLDVQPTVLDENTLLPIQAYGVKLISMGNFLQEDTPVIWRGPLLIKMIEQFLNDVDWGELDYFLIDLPPGTGDVPLTIMQKFPESRLLLVTTPQETSVHVASRTAHMAQKTNIRITGIIENMAYFVCPQCGERTEIFGHGGTERMASELGVPILGRIPIEVSLREGGDIGRPVLATAPQSTSAQVFREMAQKIINEKI